MIVSGAALLARNSEPTEDDIRWAISGNICRCTGYAKIVSAIQRAAQMRREAMAARA
jgi:carbon-monoxide dehydrogenase small subunit